MGDDTRGALGVTPLPGGSHGATGSAPGLRPLALAALVGLVLAAVPSFGGYLLSEQAINDAGVHARPLIALVVVAPLAAVMVVAAAADWLRGRGSPLAAVRQVSALALVVACFFAAVLGMTQQDILEIVGGFMLIGSAIGLGIAFALGRDADYSGPALAIAGWVGCALPLVLQMLVASFISKPFLAFGSKPDDPNSHSFFGTGEVFGYLCGGAFVAAIVIGATVVPLGGWLGIQLRGQAGRAS